MELIIIAVLLIIAAETSYLVYAHTTKTKHSKRQQTPIFVDTSVLIDGRIIAVAQSGFITSTLFIPRSVIGELQFLADNADAEKRSRARHGLDVVNELQAMSAVRVEIFNDGTKAEEGVDNRLLKLAKQYKGAICTIDFNLNKVAQVEGLIVLNVNDLAMSLRMAYLPGEKVMLDLTTKGNDSHQAVGHLTDGTMVVVEHASSQLGKSVEVEFIRSLQTAAGRMMFARLAQKPSEHRRESKEDAKPRPSRPKPAAKQPAPADKPAQAPRNNRQGPQKSRPRRRTPEDSLVELANQ